MSLTNDDLRELWDEMRDYGLDPQETLAMLLESPDINMAEFFLSGPDEEMLQLFAKSVRDSPGLARRLGRALDEDDGDLAVVLARHGLLCMLVGMTLGASAARKVLT